MDPAVFGVVGARHRYNTADLSTVVPGAAFVLPELEDRSRSSVAEDLDSLAHLAPIKWEVMLALLEELGHPNEQFIHYVVSGLRTGFRIGVTENDVGHHLPNLRTAVEWAAKVDEWLVAERSAGRLLGPYQDDALPHPRARISPLGTAHKRSYEEGVIKRRVIYHLSAGPGRDRTASVNGGTYQEPSVQYDTVEDAARVLRRFGPSAYMAKSDAEAAFRQIPVAPGAYHHLGVEWEGATYFDTRVPFGLRMAPFIYSQVSDAVRFIVQSRINIALNGDQAVILTLLDDFLVIGRTRHATQVAFDILLTTFRELGLPFVDDKTEGPRQEIEFLGVWFALDPLRGWMMGLPADKHKDLRSKLKEVFERRGKMFKHAILSVAGKLGFANPILPLGRPRVSELFRLAHAGGGYQAKHWVHVTQDAKVDCRAWFLQLGTVPPLRSVNIVVPQSVFLLTTGDASGAEGYGAFSRLGYFSASWSANLVAGQAGVSSTLQELYSALVSIVLWKTAVPPGAVIEYWTDNDNMVADLRKGRSSIRPINSLLILLADICWEHNFFVKFCWASRDTPPQVCADHLSRGQQAEFETKFREYQSMEPPRRLPTPHSEDNSVRSCLRW